MIEVELPDGTIAEFPDGMDPSQIKAVLQRRFQPQDAPTGGVPEGMTYDPVSGQYRDREMRARAHPAGMGEGMLRAGVQGMSAGFGDEAVAGLAAGVDAISGRASFGDAYTSRLEDERANLDQFRGDHPVAAYGTELAGAMVMPGAAARGATTAARAVRSGVVGAGQGAAYGAGTGEGVEGRAAGAAVGGALGGAVGAAVPYGVAGVQRALDKRAVGRAANAAAAAAPSPDDLRAQSSAVYQSVRQRGVTVKEPVYQAFAADVAQTLKSEGVHDVLTPRATAALKEVQSLAEGNVSWDSLENARRVAGIAGQSNDPNERRLAGVVTGKIDDFMENLVDGDLTSGQAANLGDDMKEARALWRRMRTSERLGEAITKAGDAASGFENGMRIEFRKLINNPKFFRSLSAEEQEAVRAVVRGTATGNILKRISRLSFGAGAQTNFLGASVGSGAAASVGGAIAGPVGAVVGAAAAPLIGRGAAAGAERATLGAAQRAQGLAAAGGISNLPVPSNLTGYNSLAQRAGRAFPYAGVNALSPEFQR